MLIIEVFSAFVQSFLSSNLFISGFEVFLNFAAVFLGTRTYFFEEGYERSSGTTTVLYLSTSVLANVLMCFQLVRETK